MLDSLAATLHSTTLNQPRAHLAGLPARELQQIQARLPNLVDVREDAKIVTYTNVAVELLKKPPPTNVHGFDQDGEDLGIVHPAIAYHFMLPHLNLFAYFCHEDDVPEDLRPLCIWALQQKVVALTECPDKQLRRMLASPNGRVDTQAKLFMELRVRSKLFAHLLSPGINLPDTALPHIQGCIELEAKSKPQAKDAFLRNPALYVQQGIVLARTRSRDPEVRKFLERVVNDIDKVNSQNVKMFLIQSKLYLSRVLRRMGEVEEAVVHEKYLISWFKKNPEVVPDKILREWFETESGHDPVFEGLGGTKWLHNRKTTWKSVTWQSRACFRCGVKETPMKRMMQCAKSQRHARWKTTLITKLVASNSQLSSQVDFSWRWAMYRRLDQIQDDWI
ncbi:hypothetical protein E1B28_000113 [Marasmius oreades]|uniref:Uncharacterized protein n=1 Tax=Marasmius oreades TaxID=181124 RepID=A0A9P8AE50_9AGAR|nr:uncharacterized protein E1B28_000113 [Marasmius oreades]KAG7098143.1 hypothetical protein E1B28_000113 [Marasmius oreades]